MAKYYYNKYTADPYTYYYESGDWVYSGEVTYPLGTQKASNYSFSVLSGYYVTGLILMEGHTTYFGNPTAVWQCIYVGKTDTDVYVNLYGRECNTVTGYQQGSLVELNIIAEDGTYPVDGYYATDGYWYVRQGLAPSFFFMNF